MAGSAMAGKSTLFGNGNGVVTKGSFRRRSLLISKLSLSSLSLTLYNLYKRVDYPFVVHTLGAV